MKVSVYLVVSTAVHVPDSGSAHRQVPVYPVCMKASELMEPQLWS